MSVTDSECVSVALAIQHAMHMRHVILPSVACPALPYFSALSHKTHDFRGKKVIEHKMCLDFLHSFLSLACPVLRRIKPHIITRVCRSSCKVSPLLSHFNETWILSIHFRTGLKYKIHKNPFF